MRFNWNGRDWSYDPEAVTTRDVATIRAHTGHGVLSWTSSILTLDEKSVEALAWLVFKQNQAEVPIDSVDVAMLPLVDAYITALGAESKAAAEKAKREADKAPKARRKGTASSGARAASGGDRTD